MVEPAVLALLVPRVRGSTDAHPRPLATVFTAVPLATVAGATQVEQLQALAAPHLSEDLGLRHLAAAQKV